MRFIPRRPGILCNCFTTCLHVEEQVSYFFGFPIQGVRIYYILGELFLRRKRCHISPACEIVGIYTVKLRCKKDPLFQKGSYNCDLPIEIAHHMHVIEIPSLPMYPFSPYYVSLLSLHSVAATSSVHTPLQKKKIRKNIPKKRS